MLRADDVAASAENAMKATMVQKNIAPLARKKKATAMKSPNAAAVQRKPRARMIHSPRPTKDPCTEISGEPARPSCNSVMTSLLDTASSTTIPTQTMTPRPANSLARVPLSRSFICRIIHGDVSQVKCRCSRSRPPHSSCRTKRRSQLPNQQAWQPNRR